MLIVGGIVFAIASLVALKRYFDDLGQLGYFGRSAMSFLLFLVFGIISVMLLVN